MLPYIIFPGVFSSLIFDFPINFILSICALISYLRLIIINKFKSERCQTTQPQS